MEQVRLFIGSDKREAVGLHVFLESLFSKTSIPVNLTVLTDSIVRTDGTNAFSKSRFLIPYLCNYQGFAIFLDGADMLLRHDLAYLWDLREDCFAVQVVKTNYLTKNPRKYIGTPLEADNLDYPRKNWSSVVIWNCGYEGHRELTPESLNSASGSYLHRFSWVPDERIGDLPKEWNHLVGESDPSPEAKLVHYTLGIPGFAHYRHDEHSAEWTNHLKAAATGLQYLGK